MVNFIDENRKKHGVGPIYKVLPIAPSTYYEQKLREKDPTKAPPRYHWDRYLRKEIKRVWDENFYVYGAHKVWQKPEKLSEAGIKPSIGSVGDSYDNALAETINGLFKAEVIWREGPWHSVESVEFAVLEWVDWFNNRKLLEPIGNIPPKEFEMMYYERQEVPAMVVGLK